MLHVPTTHIYYKYNTAQALSHTHIHTHIHATLTHIQTKHKHNVGKTTRQPKLYTKRRVRKGMVKQRHSHLKLEATVFSASRLHSLH